MAATHASTRRSEGRTARRSSKTNALTLLKGDHEDVAELLARYEKRKSRLQGEQKQQLALEICEKLEDAEELVGEAKVEHASLNHLIGHIEDGSPDSKDFDAQVKVLGVPGLAIRCYGQPAWGDACVALT